MKFHVHDEGEYTVIALKGDIDIHYSPQAREQILKYLNDGRNVLVDLSGVEYIDSSGIASLIEGYQLARRNKLRFSLVGVSEPAMQVMKLARLDKILPIRDSAGAD